MSNQKHFVFIFNEAVVCVSFEMDGNEGMRFVPCQFHREGKKLCFGVCPNGTWVPVESKRIVCDKCLASKKKCTHGLADKPAIKTKRVQEEVPTDIHAPKEETVRGKTKVVLEVPVSSIAPEKTELGTKMTFPEQDPEVLRRIKWYGANQDPELVEKYRRQEKKLEEEEFRNGLRKLLTPQQE